MGTRKDIIGLRGIAMAIFLIALVGAYKSTDFFYGIDVIFSLSGFVIASKFFKEYRKTAKTNKKRVGQISLNNYLTKNLKPLILISGVVIILTFSVTSLVFKKDFQHEALVSDAIWSILMFANLHFMANGIHHLANPETSSPFFNFWVISSYAQALLICGVIIAISLQSKELKVQGRTIRHRKRGQLISKYVLAGSAIACLIEVLVRPHTVLFGTPIRVFELAIGAYFAFIKYTAVELGKPIYSWARITALLYILFSPFLFNNFELTTVAGNQFHLVIGVSLAFSAAFIVASYDVRSDDFVFWFASLWPFQVLGKSYILLIAILWPTFSILGHLGIANNLGVKIAVSLAGVVVAYQFSKRLEKSNEKSAQVDQKVDEATSEPPVSNSLTQSQKYFVYLTISGLVILTVLVPSAAPALYKSTWSQNSQSISPSTNPSKFADMTNKPEVIFLGASITAGAYGLTKGQSNWTQLVSANYHWADVNQANPETGYSAKCRSQHSDCLNILEMSQKISNQKPSAIVVSAGHNDCKKLTSPPSVVTENNIFSVYRNLHNNFPNIPIIAMAVLSNSDNTIPSCYQVLDGWINKAAQMYGIKFVSDAGTWLMGFPQYLTKDGVHPNGQGHQQVAEKFIEWFDKSGIKVNPQGKN